MKDTYFRPLLTIAGAGLLAGAWGLVVRLLQGLYPTALGSYVPWGLWVTFYILFLGLSAGAFLVTIMTYLFGMKHFDRIGRLSAFTVLVTLIIEGQFIILDLGQWHRALYQFFLSPSFSSLMFWMFVLFSAMLVIYLLKTFFLVRGDLIAWANDPEREKLKPIYKFLSLGANNYDDAQRQADGKRVHLLAMFSLPVGLLFYGTNGAFFAVLLNRPTWNSALTPFLFIMAALLSGGALLTFLTYLFRNASQPLQGSGPSQESLCLELGRVVLWLLVVFLLLEGIQFFVGYQTRVATTVTSLDLIIKGRTWWLFWVVHILIGSVIPLFLLVFRPSQIKAVAWACFLIFITFVAVRYNFILPDLEVYKLEGLQHAFFHTRLRTDYLPTLNEWLVSVWAVSTGLVVFLLGTRYLPLVPVYGGEVHEN